MPKKQVAQYTCERCARVWYLDSDAPEPPVKLKLLLELGRSKDSKDGTALGYECLCEGCSDTVTKLVASLAPLKPRAPRAKKEDESADKGKPSSTDSTSTTAEAPAGPAGGPGASSPHAPALAAGNSGAGGPRPAPAAAPHPKR